MSFSGLLLLTIQTDKRYTRPTLDACMASNTKCHFGHNTFVIIE